MYEYQEILSLSTIYNLELLLSPFYLSTNNGGLTDEVFCYDALKKKSWKTLRRLWDFHIQAWSNKGPYRTLHSRTNKLVFFQFILPCTSFFLSANVIIYFSFNKVKYASWLWYSVRATIRGSSCHAIYRVLVVWHLKKHNFAMNPPFSVFFSFSMLFWTCLLNMNQFAPKMAEKWLGLWQLSSGRVAK